MTAIFVSGSGRNEHSLYGPSIDASYQVSVRTEEKMFLDIDQPQTRTAYGGHVL